MKAPYRHGKQDARTHNVPDPKILYPTDKVFRHKQDGCIKVVLTP
ncbi:MAG TPA: hypothetical protein VGD78_13345 [Chthoniobacterales bacterium]